MTPSGHKEYELTDEQLTRIIAASQRTPVMYLPGGRPMFSSPQENANRAWKSVASELGFKWDTVHPVAGKSANFFTAEPAA